MSHQPIVFEEWKTADGALDCRGSAEYAESTELTLPRDDSAADASAKTLG